MKAKDYAKEYDNANNENVVKITAKVVLSYFKEIDEIMQKRNGKTNEALIAAMQEQVDKWRAMAKHTTWIKPDGFKIWLETEMPELAGTLK